MFGLFTPLEAAQLLHTYSVCELHLWMSKINKTRLRFRIVLLEVRCTLKELALEAAHVDTDGRLRKRRKKKHPHPVNVKNSARMKDYIMWFGQNTVQ